MRCNKHWAIAALSALVSGSLAAGATAADCVVRDVAANITHSLVLAADGAVLAMGMDDFGQLGGGQPDPDVLQPLAVRAAGAEPAIAIAAGERHSLALLSDGSVWSWGGNSSGQLGDGTIIDRAMPGPVSGLPPVIAIAAGRYHSLAVADDGTVWGWGENRYGQLGDASRVDHPSPIQVGGIDGAIAVSAGAGASMAVTMDGSVWTWGTNTSGELGRGLIPQFLPVPGQVPGLGPAQAVGAGLSHGAALLVDGTVWSWGNNDFGQLGDGTWGTPPPPQPVQATAVTSAAQISVGGNWTMALARDGRVWGWGENSSQIRLPTIGDVEATPLLLPVPPGIVRIAAGWWYHALAVDVTSSLWGWGKGARGELGPDAFSGAATPPIQIPLDTAPEPQSNLLRAHRDQADVIITWAVAGARRWRVFRDADPVAIGSSALVPDATLPRFVDQGAVGLVDSPLFYGLRGVSSCSLSAGP